MNIYIACGLTHTPRHVFHSYSSFIHKLAQALSDLVSKDVRYALKDSDPQLADKPFADRARLCYTWDKDMVEEADIIIAEASYPSTGLGIEIQIADSARIPIIVCFKRSEDNLAQPIEYENPDQSHHMLQIGEGYVSLMALGVPSVFKVITYDDDESGISKICEAVALFTK